MQNVLNALKDIPGVVGSFVLNNQGALVSREMPSVYPDELYPELGRRLLSVQEAVSLQALSFGDLLLKFEGYWFLCRRTAQCFLGILATETVNYPALRMASNVALKQIDGKVAGMMPLNFKSAAAAAAPTPAKKTRIFRGQIVED